MNTQLKQLFDLMVSTQSQMMNNFLETSKKLPEIVGKGDALQKTSELYKELYDKQKETLERASTLLQANAGDIPFVPDFLKGMSETMTNFSKSMMDSVGVIVQNASTPNLDVDKYQEQVGKMFETMEKQYQDTLDKLGAPFNQMPFNPVSMAKDMNERLLETVKQYSAMVKKSS
ncbi:hypothetical protein [Eisenibacter elegans]|jgi:hypothetical protein|uniref:hypothetical protein n=1 Tax=Eisenibacter elegans TaxID=997 RepID=UPI0003F83E4F|nr:hypothetical protein [Eisenibacter elegans]